VKRRIDRLSGHVHTGDTVAVGIAMDHWFLTAGLSDTGARTRMCDGWSCPSWTISSAKSVSMGMIPAASRASLRPISWVDRADTRPRRRHHVIEVLERVDVVTDQLARLALIAGVDVHLPGHRQVSIVLGSDVPDLPEHWVLYPLVIGGDRVGTVFLDSRHPEGPEPRQDRVVRHLLPTVSLVAKAVSLAVEADHVRQDLARERDAERARRLRSIGRSLRASPTLYATRALSGSACTCVPLRAAEFSSR